MKNRICILFLIMFFAFSGSTFAQGIEYEYKSKSGKTLAPILDGGMTAVVKVDLKKADPEKIAAHVVDFAKMLIPLFIEEHDEGESNAKDITEWLKSSADELAKTAEEKIKKLSEQGKADEFFILFNVEDMQTINSPIFVIPVSEKTKDETDEIRRVAGELEMKLTFVRHGFIWAISNTWNEDEVWKYVGERFRTITPIAYPELDEAFLALEAEENAAQLVFLLTDVIQDAFDEVTITEEQLENMSRYSSEETVEAMRKMMKPQEEFFDAMIKGYRWGGLSVDIEKPAIRFVIQMKDAKTAKSLHQAAKDMIGPLGDMMLGETGPMGMGFMFAFPFGIILVGEDAFEEIFPAPADSRILGRIDETNGPGIAQKAQAHFAKLKEARIAARRKTKCQDNLKQILLAFHNYHDTNNSFPPAYTCDDDGMPLHSWRVLILPFMEQQELYSQIKLDEPWDSEHNKQFHEKIPEFYFCPDRVDAEIAAGKKPTAGLCDYAVITGTGCFFDGDEMRSIARISDGTSNTIAVVERKTPVCWMAPSDIPQDEAEKGINVAEKGVGSVHEEGVNVAFFDGSVRRLKPTVTKRALKAAITNAGGENISINDQREDE